MMFKNIIHVYTGNYTKSVNMKQIIIDKWFLYLPLALKG